MATLGKAIDLPAVVNSPDFIANMKAFAQTGLTLEVANPRVDLIDATVRLTDKVPELRVVLGHLQALPSFRRPRTLWKAYSENLREHEKTETVYAEGFGAAPCGQREVADRFGEL